MYRYLGKVQTIKHITNVRQAELFVFQVFMHELPLGKIEQLTSEYLEFFFMNKTVFTF